jgi:hypothetical protein
LNERLLGVAARPHDVVTVLQEAVRENLTDLP